MALQEQELGTTEQWKEFFVNELKVSKDISQRYAAAFVDEGYDGASIKHLLAYSTPGVPSPSLLELGFKAGHCLKLAMYFNPSSTAPSSTSTHNMKVKIPRPIIALDASQNDFDQFCFEWKTYRSHYQLHKESIASHLLYCGSEDVRRRIRIEHPSFTTSTQHSEDELLLMLKAIVLSKTSKIVHCKQFRGIEQLTNEPASDFLARLQLKASCCGFTCSHCGEETVKDRVKEQFILGLANRTVLTAILKTESVNPGTPLDKLLAECMTLEQSIKDQQHLRSDSRTDNLFALDDESVSGNEDEQVKALSRPHKQNRNRNNSQMCSGCGKSNHHPNEREAKCPAWGRKCFGCGVMNHFSSVCRSQKNNQRSNNNNANNSGKRSTHFIEMTCMSAGDSKSNFICVQMKPTSHRNNDFVSQTLSVFPDTGANICLLGPKQLRKLGLKEKEMTPCSVRISVAGGTHLHSSRKTKLEMSLHGKTTEQFAYFSNKADRFFLSRQACIGLGMIPSSFPHPPGGIERSKELCVAQGNLESVETPAEGNPEPDRTPPKKPDKIPFKPTPENINKLKCFLVREFASSAFNRSEPFPKLPGPQAKIHLFPDHKVPKPAYWPATVAEHWADEVWGDIKKDIRRNIQVRVPLNEPSIWCARLVVVRKKNGRPRRTVDYQQLNAQCLREPSHGESPFHTARRIPQNTWKSTFDAVDGYHSVELDEESSKLTTYITPWGRFRYLRFPQGHCSAGDAFNARVQQILAHIPRLVRVVDDMCIHDDTIENAFWHAWEVLTCCAKNGIVVNEEKFQFCSRTVEFAGLSVTAEGIEPSLKMISAIKNFPAPNDISSARAFFGLVNQVQWAYANSNEMAPFRDLVRPNACFTWTSELKKLFEECKEKILNQVSKGVKKYDTQRDTCLQTDFSKDGIGYLLLQKYCDCPLDEAPLCCPEGWKLVFAGSRFTKGAEARYAPTEGEALAISWALNHAHIFTKGCPRLIISTDHKPLLGIFNSKPLEAIKNPRLVRLKEQTLPFTFSLKYTRGKWNRGPDALSRYPDSKSSRTELMKIFCDDADHQEAVESAAEIAMADICPNSSVTLDEIREATASDPELKSLASAIQAGFPDTHHSTDPLIRQYFNVRDELWIQKDIVMFRNRIVIPKAFRNKMLQHLHSAHQGVEGMRARATSSIYWPGLSSGIKQTRTNCQYCNHIAPSQARQPLQLIPAPEYPFQHVCVDAFEMNKHQYIVAVDRYSGWNVVFSFTQHPQSKDIVRSLRSLFSVYGTPEKLFSDGGLPFQSQEFKHFLATWKIDHVTSSAHYAQANGRAELAVKAAKRALQENVDKNGSLNTDGVCRALLQYRNTPIQHLGLSPAQILFHRNLRDGIPTDPRNLRPHRQWIKAAHHREEAFKERNESMVTRYNSTTRELSPLSIGTTVLIQDHANKRRWNKSGSIVDVDNRKYVIKMDGSGRVVTRNRRFIKPTHLVVESDVAAELLPSASYDDGLSSDQTGSVDITPNPALDQGGVPTEAVQRSPSSVTDSSGIPRALTRLMPYNMPGLKESQ